MFNKGKEAEEYAHLPYGLGYLIPQCWLHWDQTKDAQGVELLLDHHLFASMLALAESLKLPEIVAWVRHKIDAENLRSAVRLQRMGVDAAGGFSFFHPGGNIRPEDAGSRFTSDCKEKVKITENRYAK